jgi:hypothetical protein
MLRMFDKAELLNPNFNVCGRAPKGVNISKEPLDPVRINQIFDICMSFENGTQAEKASEWKKIRAEMTKKTISIETR